jgi:hypothetical protein
VEKIREAEGSRDLERIAEDVLPNVEKFLESPQEKRLRRARAGVLTAATGVGAGILALLLLTTTFDQKTITFLIMGLGLAFAVFFIGLGLIVNSMFFTVPGKHLPIQPLDEKPLPGLDNLQASTGPILNEASPLTIASVTEHTTKHLANKR